MWNHGCPLLTIAPGPFSSVNPSSVGAACSLCFPASNFRIVREFSSIVLMDYLGRNELLVLQNPWEIVKESLPDVLDRKQYGV